MTATGARGVTAAVTVTAKKSAAVEKSLLKLPVSGPGGASTPDRHVDTTGLVTATVLPRRDAEPSHAQGAVTLRGEAVDLQSDAGVDFILDCARNVEGMISDAEIKSKWQLSDQEWASLANNAAFLSAVWAEHERRLLSGETATEAAQRYFAKAPGVLNRIMTDEQTPPRHRIEAARELRQAAAGGPEIEAAPKKKFTITINLGAVKEVYEKTIDPRGPLLLDEGDAS
jgi:hypothetical protein